MSTMTRGDQYVHIESGELYQVISGDTRLKRKKDKQWEKGLISYETLDPEDTKVFTTDQKRWEASFRRVT